MGALLRRYQDPVAGYRLRAVFPEGPRVPSPGQVVCHGDTAPRNTVFTAGLPVALVDWDGAWIADPLTGGDAVLSCWLARSEGFEPPAF